MSYIIISSLQVLGALIISIIMMQYYRQYQRPYLRYWALSFASLTIFLSTGVALSWLVDVGFSYASVGLYALSASKLTAGFLQIVWLFIGCYALTWKQLKRNKFGQHFVLLSVALGIALSSLYAFDQDGAQFRYLIRTSSRYIIGGLCFIFAAIYLYQKLSLSNLGQTLVITAFLLLGIEMALLGALSLTQYYDVLVPLVTHHGAVELLLYSLIGLGLVMWLLDSERAERQAIRERLNSLGNHDSLTGLINRKGFEQFITQCQSGKTKYTGDLSVVLFGVDKFKRINEAGGVKQGDEVLASLARRFKQYPERAIAKARISGDVFACLLSSDIANEASLEQLRKTLSKNIRLPNQTYHIDMSLGATQVKLRQSPETILLNAQRALQYAKQLGGRTSAIFNRSTPDAPNSIDIENQLRTALVEQEFCLYLQPIYKVSGEEIVGFEGLVRWQHPERGVLPPVEFLPHLAQLELMPQLDRWVLNEAARVIKLLRKATAHEITIAINLSTEGLNDNAYIDQARQLSKSMGSDISKLHLEITETSAMTSINSGKFAIATLHDLGIKISLDDFGTGYSSLSYFRELPLHKLKIDQAFVRDIRSDKNDRVIVETIIAMARLMELDVIAEGVEEEYQLNFLKEKGCYQYQGYYFDKPVPAEVFYDTWVANRNAQQR